MLDVRQAVIAEARSWIGTPYRHQGALKGVGCDCLGLVRGVWSAVYGYEPESPPSYSSDWAEASKEETLLAAARRHLTEVPLDAMAPGDVILFRWRPHLPSKHLGILVAPDRMVHAYDAAGKVAEGNLAAAWRRKISAVFAFPPIEAQ
jgi:NlpC/P60 family putative phage cell wall peptidase